MRRGRPIGVPHRSSTEWAFVDGADGAESSAVGTAAAPGLSEHLRQLLGIRVDVVAADVLRDPVAASAVQSIIPLP